jgi:hypothetical protein
MQDLFKYKGYSLFCYCTHLEQESDKYIANLILTNIENKLDPEKPLRLERAFNDLEVALNYAIEEGKRLVDKRISTRPKKPSENDTDLNYRDMKKNIE